MTDSPLQTTEGSNFQESPYLDYDLDFAGADSSFDFSFDGANGARMIGDLPGSESPKSDTKSESPDPENGDKRSHPDDDDDEPLGGGRGVKAKRRCRKSQAESR